MILGGTVLDLICFVTRLVLFWKIGVCMYHASLLLFFDSAFAFVV